MGVDIHSCEWCAGMLKKLITAHAVTDSKDSLALKLHVNNTAVFVAEFWCTVPSDKVLNCSCLPLGLRSSVPAAVPPWLLPTPNPVHPTGPNPDSPCTPSLGPTPPCPNPTHQGLGAPQADTKDQSLEFPEQCKG